MERVFERVPISLSMSLRAYLWGIRLFLLLSFSAWIAIIIAVEPYQAGAIGRGLFFVSFFGTVLGFMTLLVTWVYEKSLGGVSTAHHLGGAFRQAFFLSFFLVLLVFLQMKQALTWWDSLLALAAILLIEFSFRGFINRES